MNWQCFLEDCTGFFGLFQTCFVQVYMQKLLGTYIGTPGGTSWVENGDPWGDCVGSTHLFPLTTRLTS